MRHVISDYALEQKTKDGKPSGNFYMDKKQTLNAAKETIKKFQKVLKCSENS